MTEQLRIDPDGTHIYRFRPERNLWAAYRFVDWVGASEVPAPVLTNNSLPSREELAAVIHQQVCRGCDGDRYEYRLQDLDAADEVLALLRPTGA